MIYVQELTISRDNIIKGISQQRQCRRAGQFVDQADELVPTGEEFVEVGGGEKDENSGERQGDEIHDVEVSFEEVECVTRSGGFSHLILEEEWGRGCQYVKWFTILDVQKPGNKKGSVFL